MIVQFEPMEADWTEREEESGMHFLSVKPEKEPSLKRLAWGVLLGVLSVKNGRGKRTKGAVRLEGTLQGPGGTLQH
jgi:hypothetical protein